MATLKKLSQTPHRAPQRTLPWLVFLLFTLTFAGCTRVNAGPPPTRTPIPTFTPSPTYDVLATKVADAAIATATANAPTITPTPINTETPTVTPTPTVALAKVVVKSQVNIRVGPSTLHPLLGSAQPGESFTVTAKSNDGAWWQIDYNGQTGWLFGELVEAQNVDTVIVATDIPTPPPPPPTLPPPPPTATFTPVATNTPSATNTPAIQYDYILKDMGKCETTTGLTQYQGVVRYNSGSERNNTCVHIAFWGPRQTKCSGCDESDQGRWSFAPFGENPPTDTFVEIYVVNCPTSGIPPGGQNTDFVNLTPLSPKWTHTVKDKVICSGITFTSKD